MTDISNWPALVRQEGRYTVVPLNPYQMGNLVDALSQATENGDWWNEILNIVWEAMGAAGLETLTSNSGRTFTRTQIFHRDIRKAPSPAPDVNENMRDVLRWTDEALIKSGKIERDSIVHREIRAALAASEPPHTEQEGT